MTLQTVIDILTQLGYKLYSPHLIKFSNGGYTAIYRSETDMRLAVINRLNDYRRVAGHMPTGDDLKDVVFDVLYNFMVHSRG